MSAFVVLHISFGSEALSTPLRTHKRSLVPVDSHVNAQVLLLREGFPTARMFTFKGLSAVVDVKVSVKSHFSGENFLTVFVRANEGAFLLIFWRSKARSVVFV